MGRVALCFMLVFTLIGSGCYSVNSSQDDTENVDVKDPTTDGNASKQQEEVNEDNNAAQTNEEDNPTDEIEEPTEIIDDNTDDADTTDETNQAAGVSAETAAEHIVLALSNQDMQTVASYVHPSQGVRFSPYCYINVQTDLVFTANQVQGLDADPTLYLWGSFDGTGDLIEMTFSDYYGRFVYDQDYVNPEQMVTNTRLGSGLIDNSSQVYPNATVVEFHFSGFNPDYMGMDWRSLRLVLEQVGNQWFLLGIIHDEWTT